MDDGALLDMFDFDLDIDFETAYDMISNNVCIGEDSSESSRPKQGEDNTHQTTSFFTQEQLSFEETRQTSIDSKTSHSPRTENVYGANTSHNDMLHFHNLAHGLLSVNESHAIENFLDSVLTSKNDTNQNSKSDINAVDSDFSMVENEKNALSEKETLNNAVDLAETNKLADAGPDRRDENLQYMPVEVEFPEISIPQFEIPVKVLEDPEKLKKWKHVYLEKKRRDTIKDQFDHLVKKIRFPRPDKFQVMNLRDNSRDKVLKIEQETYDKSSKVDKIFKPLGKRIPKHVMLNYIIEDIELLLLANKKLEDMVNSIN